MNIEKYFFLIITVALLSCLAVCFSSCKEDRCSRKKDFDYVDIDISVDRLEASFDRLESPEEVVEFFHENRVMADFFLDAKQYPNDTILANRFFRLVNDPYIDSLRLEVGDYYSDFDEENMPELRSAFQFVKHHYPRAEIPKIQTMVSGQYNDLYVSDTLIVIGLDFFMGIHAKNPPNDVPRYIVKRYMKESVAPIVMSFVSNEFNQIDDSHGTLLADMVNIGKSYYFVSAALPCTPDSLISGYTSEEMRLVEENQEVIWANLIENELLYETNYALKNKFIGESPNIYEISEKCPGRVGAWLGWQIVKKYMKSNPDVSLQDLMNEKDAHQLFQLSGYKPRNVKH